MSKDSPEDPQKEDIQKEDPQNIKLAGDSIIFGFNADSLKLDENELDPITKAVREEILMKQLSMLKEAYATHGKEDGVKNYDNEEFRKYLRSEQGKLELEELSKRPEIEQGLNNIEVSGYKAVHSQFADNFQDVEWVQDASSDIKRSTEVTGPNGEKIASIVETTHNTSPATVTLSNGTTQQISSYRTIDFPQELDSGKGPMHVSMAVKDANGNNIEEDKAVYFTAHYDKQGKLTEVSSPQPVKFSGEGKDAVAYIERGGEVYTLAVTKGKYMDMMQEVAKNKGTSLDISQPQINKNQPTEKLKEENITIPLEVKTSEEVVEVIKEENITIPVKVEHSKEVVKEVVEIKQKEDTPKAQIDPATLNEPNKDDPNLIKEFDNTAKKLASQMQDLGNIAQKQTSKKLSAVQGKAINQAAVAGATMVDQKDNLKHQFMKAGTDFSAAMSDLRNTLSASLTTDKAAEELNDNSRSKEDVNLMVEQGKIKKSELKEIYNKSMNNAITAKNAPMALRTARSIDALYKNMTEKDKQSIGQETHKKNLDNTRSMKSSSKETSKGKDNVKSMQERLAAKSSKSPASTSHVATIGHHRKKNNNQGMQH